MSERNEQGILFAWADALGNAVPELGHMFAIPNGQMRPGQPKEPGLKAGVPDLFLPAPRNGKAGLFIEMKYGRNRPNHAQANWLRWLESAGYECTVCWSAEEAIEVIRNYLEI